MKKIITLILSLILVLSLVACSNTSTTGTPNDPSINTDTVVEETNNSVPIDTLLFDANDIKITGKSFILGDEWNLGPYLTFTVENNTNKNITVQIRDCSINSFMIDPICSTDVVAGKKANDDMTWLYSDFEANDITTIETIEFYFHIFDSDSWDTIIDSDTITLTFN